MELLPLLCLCLLTRSGITSAQEKGAAAAPSVTSLEGTKDWARLWCQVKGVSPKPEVRWQDSAGNNLTAETQGSETGGSYDITLLTTVTKTDNYSCVVTQRELKHQIASHIHVYIHGPTVITVEGGTDVILPCSLSTKENIEFKLFDWRKVAQKDAGEKEVFLYDGGSHYNNGLDGQSEQFKGRVSHFPDELKHGNASIIIRNTKISDSGEYTCYFPRLYPPQIFHIELVVEPSNVIKVKEDSDVMLPCSLSNKNIESELFDWKTLPQKDERRKEVFMYNNGIHYNNDNKTTGQSKEFKGRVSHFPDELKHGNASIIIRNTTISDSGVYICDFPNLQPPQIFYIKLVVVGAAPKPSVNSLEETKDWSLLRCEVHGDPEPEVEWQDSDGNQLPAEKPQVKKIGDLFYITLNTTVTKSDRYRCVATQKKINHQISNEISVYISEPPSEPPSGLHTATIAAVVFFLLFAVTAFLLVVAVYMYKREKKKRHSLNNSTLDPLKPATD